MSVDRFGLAGILGTVTFTLEEFVVERCADLITTAAFRAMGDCRNLKARARARPCARAGCLALVWLLQLYGRLLLLPPVRKLPILVPATRMVAVPTGNRWLQLQSHVLCFLVSSFFPSFQTEWLLYCLRNYHTAATLSLTCHQPVCFVAVSPHCPPRMGC